MLKRYPVPSCIAAGLCCIFLLSGAQSSRADFSTNAVNNATVQVAGPRTGANGKRFLNMEGSNNGNFSSYGVLDFQTPAGTLIGQANSLTLTLTESNAAFTNAGPLSFFLTTDVTTDIEPGTSPLRFDMADLPTGLNGQLSTNYLLGTGSFNTTGNVNTGQMDAYTFALGGPAQTYLTNQINAGGRLRLIVAPGSASVAATFTGFTNTALPVPSLSVAATAAVPEPSVVALLFSGGAVMALYRRRRR